MSALSDEDPPTADVCVWLVFCEGMTEVGGTEDVSVDEVGLAALDWGLKNDLIERTEAWGCVLRVTESNLYNPPLQSSRSFSARSVTALLRRRRVTAT